MKKLTAGLMALSYFLTPFTYAAQTLSAQDIQSAQAAGKAIASMASSQAPTFNADGSLAIDPQTGNAKTTPKSRKSISDQANAFQAMTGVTGTQVTGGGVAVNTSNFADISCMSDVGRRKSIGSLVAKLQGCNYAGTVVQGMTVQVCSALSVGGVCDDKSFTPINIQVGSWSSLSNGQIGASCNGGLCRVTARVQSGLSNDSNALKQQAQAQMAATGSNNYQSTMKQAQAQKTDAQKQAAQNIAACFTANQTRQNQGLPPLTCDGTQEVGLPIGPASSTSSAGAACTQDTMTCLRQATQTVTYQQTCTRTFPTTQYSCTYSIPTKNCSVTVDSSGKESSSCSASDTQGGTKVGSTQTDGSTSWTDYYVFPDQKTLSGQCSVYPAPLKGSSPTAEGVCANRGQGPLVGCADGGWFGRTLDDSQCTASTSTPAGGNGVVQQSIQYYTNNDKPGCGYCVKPVYADTCYAQPNANEATDNCSQIPSNCTPQGSPVVNSSADGLTLSQTENYTCTRQQTTCALYQQNPGCPATTAFGLDKAPPSLTNGGQFNQAITDAAIANAYAKSLQTANHAAPRIFDGADLRCRQPVDYASGQLINNCCDINLKHTGGNQLIGKCTEDEVKLAASRRAKEVVYMGDYCSRSIKLGPGIPGGPSLEKCVERTQTYCAFDGVLDRLIQTQGRAQLSSMAQAGVSSAQSQQVNFAYYSGNGGWGKPITLNGVTVVPWQYPSYCNSPDNMQKAYASDASALQCPNVLTQWFATCEKGNCGNLPFTPEMGSDSWLIQQLDPLTNHVESISPHATASGACDPTAAQCQYKITAWPAASGGTSTISRTWNFALYAASSSNIYGLGNYLFQPQSLQGTSDGKTMPPTVQVRYSPNAGTTWATLDLPTQTTGDGVHVPNSDIVISGGCDAAANSCKYTAIGSVAVTTKPWGSAQSPDCSGFSITQVSVMDFSKMDLSEWFAAAMDSMNASNGSQTSVNIDQQAQNLYNGFQSGHLTVSGSGSQVAVITPTAALGPFNAQLVVSAYWPYQDKDPSKNTDPVGQVEVDWGDCTTPTFASKASERLPDGSTAVAFKANHNYVEPDKQACNAKEGDVDENVKVTITSASGVHYTNLKVTNLWQNRTGHGAGLDDGTGGGKANNQYTIQLPQITQ